MTETTTDPLLAELVDHPDDVDRYLVLADALLTRGDPRGELIAIQCRLAAGATEELRAREHELIATFEAELLASLPDESVTLEWRAGFVHSVEIAHNAIEPMAASRWLASHPCLDLVRSIRFGPGRGPEDRSLHVLLDAPASAIERVQIGGSGSSWSAEALSELCGHLPRLRTLELGARTLPDVAPLAKIVDLSLWLSAMENAELETLLAAPLALNRLVLSPGGSRSAQADGFYDSLAPLLDGTCHPALEHLAVMRPSVGARLIVDLPNRAILPRLRSLGLVWTQLTTEGEAALERARAAFARVTLVWPRPPGSALSSMMAYHLGVLLRIRLGRAAEALPYYQQASELAPKRVDNWWALGNALGDLERRDEQLAAYARGLEVDPRHPSVLSQRGRALIKLGRFADAIDDFTRAVEATPGHVSAWNELGTLHCRFDRIDEAVACFERAIAIDPTHRAGRNLVEALLEYQRPDHALRVIESLRAAEPDDAELARKQGRVHLALGDPPAALAIAIRLCTTGPFDYFSTYLRMIALRELGHGAEALEMCDLLAKDEELSHARIARLQRAVIAKTPESLDVDGVDGVAHDGCTDCAVLAIAAAVVRGERAIVDVRRAALDRYLGTRHPGFARTRCWDLIDTLATIGRIADPVLVELVTTSYAVATGRATR